MKALVITKFGDPEALVVQEVPAPVAETGQILVKVEAGGLNFADVMTLQGGYPGTPKPPLVVGREFAGREEHSSRRVMDMRSGVPLPNKPRCDRSCCGPFPTDGPLNKGPRFP